MAEGMTSAEERLGWHVDRMNRLEWRLQTAEALLRNVFRKFYALEVRLASKPDDFGGVTSTGATRQGTRRPAPRRYAPTGRRMMLYRRTHFPRWWCVTPW